MGGDQEPKSKKMKVDNNMKVVNVVHISGGSREEKEMKDKSDNSSCYSDETIPSCSGEGDGFDKPASFGQKARVDHPNANKEEAIIKNIFAQIASEEVWDANFLKLVDFKKQHGSNYNRILQNIEHSELNQWVGDQRIMYVQFQRELPQTLTARKIAALDSIDFDWNLQDSWCEQFENLYRYRNERKSGGSSCLYPKVSIPPWVKEQFAEYRKLLNGKKSSLSKERYVALRSLDFFHSDTISALEEKHEHLSDCKNLHDSSLVLMNAVGFDWKYGECSDQINKDKTVQQLKEKQNKQKEPESNETVKSKHHEASISSVIPAETSSTQVTEPRVVEFCSSSSRQISTSESNSVEVDQKSSDSSINNILQTLKEIKVPRLLMDRHKINGATTSNSSGIGDNQNRNFGQPPNTPLNNLSSNMNNIHQQSKRDLIRMVNGAGIKENYETMNTTTSAVKKFKSNDNINNSSGSDSGIGIGFVEPVHTQTDRNISFFNETTLPTHTSFNHINNLSGSENRNKTVNININTDTVQQNFNLTANIPFPVVNAKTSNPGKEISSQQRQLVTNNCPAPFLQTHQTKPYVSEKERKAEHEICIRELQQFQRIFNENQKAFSHGIPDERIQQFQHLFNKNLNAIIHGMTDEQIQQFQHVTNENQKAIKHGIPDEQIQQFQHVLINENQKAIEHGIPDKQIQQYQHVTNKNHKAIEHGIPDEQIQQFQQVINRNQKAIEQIPDEQIQQFQHVINQNQKAIDHGIQEFQQVINKNQKAIEHGIPEEQIQEFQPVINKNQKAIEQISDEQIKFQHLMNKSRKSMELLQAWDRRMGLSRAHSRTMLRSNKSRKEINKLHGKPHW